MAGRQSKPAGNIILLYVACYVTWVALSVLGLYVAIVWRSATIDLTTLVTDDVLSIALADKVVVILLMLAWLVFVVVLETYLRAAVTHDRLWSLAAKVLVAEVVLLAVAYLV